jgi:hypothetical protein
MVLRTVEVDSAGDQRLADYTQLTDARLRTYLEAEHGLFIAEGTKVITRAVAAGYPVRSMLLARSRLADLSGLPGMPALGLAGAGGEASDAEAPVYVVPDEVAEQLTGYRVYLRISWTTAMSARSSGAPPRSAWTRWSCRRGAPTRCTGGR